MAVDLLQALTGMNTGVVIPQGQPIQPAANPMQLLAGAPSGAIPAATPAPQLTANPGNQVQSLEELLFGLGDKLYG